MPVVATQPTPLRRRWTLAWVIAVLSVFTLPGSWYWWSHERLSARQLQQSQTREAVLAPLEEKVSARLAAWKAARANVSGMQEKLKARGETPAHWNQRTLTIDNQRMSRIEAEQYLGNLAADDQNMLAPTVINVRSVKPNESIFITHKGQDHDAALMLTIKADLYTKGAR